MKYYVGPAFVETSEIVDIARAAGELGYRPCATLVRRPR
jgi:hypothetical protein